MRCWFSHYFFIQLMVTNSVLPCTFCRCSITLSIVLSTILSLEEVSTLTFIPQLRSFRQYKNSEFTSRSLQYSHKKTYLQTCLSKKRKHFTRWPVSRLQAVKIRTEEAEEGFVDHDENLEDGEICVLAVKAFATIDSDGIDRFLCAGALVQRHQPHTYLNSDAGQGNKQPQPAKQYTLDAWMADSPLEHSIGGPNLQIQGAVEVLDKLFCHFLFLAHKYSFDYMGRGRKATWAFVVQCGAEESIASFRAALARGFLPIEYVHYHSNASQLFVALGSKKIVETFMSQKAETNYCTANNSNNSYDDQYDLDDGLMFDHATGVQQYTTTALEMIGTPAGIMALKILSYLSSHRLPHHSAQSSSRTLVGETLVRGDIFHFPKFLSSKISSSVLKLVLDIDEQQADYGGSGFCTDFDSVDGLPSLHLSLIADGKPLFNSLPFVSAAKDNGGDTQISSPTDVLSLKILEIITPHVENILLPAMRKVMNVTTLQVSDVFIRRYGELPKIEKFGLEYNIENESESTNCKRYGIPAHYDVFNMATAVIALDDSACTGENGLYTVLSGPNGQGGTNHPSLRRYFSMDTGDAILHPWDVQHGVDVKPGTSRTSCVIWFIDCKETSSSLTDGKSSARSLIHLPWLSIENDSDDDVRNFVLASALESMTYLFDNNHGSDSFNFNGLCPHNPISLYIKSASAENTNALTRLGNACKEKELTPSQVLEVESLLDQIAGSSNRGFLDPLEELGIVTCIDLDIDSASVDNEAIHLDCMARRLWYEAAKRGNYLAQIALAEECMELLQEPLSATGGVNKLQGLLLPKLESLSCVLFCLAAQQDYKDAYMSLYSLLNLKHPDASDISDENKSFFTLFDSIFSENSHLYSKDSKMKALKDIVLASFISSKPP